MSQATDFLVIPRISKSSRFHPDFIIRFHQISQDPVFSLSSEATTMLTPVCDTDYEQYDRPKQNQGLLKVKQSSFTKIRIDCIGTQRSARSSHTRSPLGCSDPFHFQGTVFFGQTDSASLGWETLHIAVNSVIRSPGRPRRGRWTC